MEMERSRGFLAWVNGSGKCGNNCYLLDQLAAPANHMCILSIADVDGNPLVTYFYSRALPLLMWQPALYMLNKQTFKGWHLHEGCWIGQTEHTTPEPHPGGTKIVTLLHATSLCLLQALTPDASRLWVSTTSPSIRGYDLNPAGDTRDSTSGGGATADHAAAAVAVAGSLGGAGSGSFSRGTPGSSRAFMGSSPSVRFRRHSVDPQGSEAAPTCSTPAVTIPGVPGGCGRLVNGCMDGSDCTIGIEKDNHI